MSDERKIREIVVYWLGILIIITIVFLLHYLGYLDILQRNVLLIVTTFWMVLDLISSTIGNYGLLRNIYNFLTRKEGTKLEESYKPKIQIKILIEHGNPNDAFFLIRNSDVTSVADNIRFSVTDIKKKTTKEYNYLNRIPFQNPNGFLIMDLTIRCRNLFPDKGVYLLELQYLAKTGNHYCSCAIVEHTDESVPWKIIRLGRSKHLLIFRNKIIRKCKGCEIVENIHGL